MKKIVLFITIACFALSFPAPAISEESDIIQKLIKKNQELEQRLEKLERKINEGKQEEIVERNKMEEEIASLRKVQEEGSNLLEIAKGVKVSGFGEVSYSYNFNNPSFRDDANALRVFDRDDNSFNIDLFELVFEKEVTEVGQAGFRIDLDFGKIADLEDAGNDSFGDSDDDFDIQQAYLIYKAPIGSGLEFKFGKFVTWLGGEVIESRDNPNYSRSYLFGYAIPFTHTGLGMTYAFNDKLYYSQYVVNGWDIVDENNDGKTFGGQLGFTPTENASFYLNWIHGSEQDENDDEKRWVIDLVASLKLNNRLSFLLNYDYGEEEEASITGGNARWHGVSGIAIYELTEKLNLALRGEWFQDTDGARTGDKQDLKEITLTTTYKLTDALTGRFEYRHDWSTRNVYFDDHHGFDDRQNTIAFNLVYSF